MSGTAHTSLTDDTPALPGAGLRRWYTCLGAAAALPPTAQPRGFVVVHPFVEAVLVRIAARQGAPAAGVSAPGPHSLRLVGDLERVTGLGTVSEGTSVLMFSRSGSVELLPAGTVVMPALRRSTAPSYLVLNHRPVSLDLTLRALQTVDRRTLDLVFVRLGVRLAEPATGIVELAREHGPRLEAELLRRLADEVSRTVTTAVRMNRLADLERLSLKGVLQAGWLGSSLVGGLLLRTDLHVLDVSWSTPATASAGAGRGAKVA